MRRWATPTHSTFQRYTASNSEHNEWFNWNIAILQIIFETMKIPSYPPNRYVDSPKLACFKLLFTFCDSKAFFGNRAASCSGRLSCVYTVREAKVGKLRSGYSRYLLKLGQPFINNFEYVKLSNCSRSLSPVETFRNVKF